MFLGICNVVEILQKGCHLKYIFEMVNVSHPINITLFSYYEYVLDILFSQITTFIKV